MEKIKVVFADDHEIFRDGIRLMLERESAIDIVGEACNGRDLIAQVKLAMPDIVLTDIVMPEINGIEAAKQITMFNPNVGIIALSMIDEEGLILEMLEAGALGYLLKNADKAEISEAIRVVNNQKPYYCSSISSTLAKAIAASRKFNPYKNSRPIRFNDNELEIIRFVCEELTSKEMADKLQLSTRTVEGYRRKIMEKIDVKTPAGIAIYAIKSKLYLNEVV